MSKDWTGNKRTTFVTLGASNHVKEERAEHDYYATDPIAAQLLLENVGVAHKIWECACGEGHLSKVFEHYGHKVVSTDLGDRGYGQCADFLAQEGRWEGDIVTNPPTIEQGKQERKEHFDSLVDWKSRGK